MQQDSLDWLISIVIEVDSIHCRGSLTMHPVCSSYVFVFQVGLSLISTSQVATAVRIEASTAQLNASNLQLHCTAKRTEVLTVQIKASTSQIGDVLASNTKVLEANVCLLVYLLHRVLTESIDKTHIRTDRFFGIIPGIWINLP